MWLEEETGVEEREKESRGQNLQGHQKVGGGREGRGYE